MARRKKSPRTAEGEALELLLGETPFMDREDTDERIRARLEAYLLKPLPPARMDRLRQFKDDLQAEIQKGRLSRFADLRTEELTFDRARLVKSYREQYPELAPGIIEQAVDTAVFTWQRR